MKHPDTVTASEIADFVFCPKAFRLRLLDAPPSPELQAARTAGTSHHVEKAAVETLAGRSIDAGLALFLAGLVVLAALAALWAGTR